MGSNRRICSEMRIVGGEYSFIDTRRVTILHSLDGNWEVTFRA